MASMAINGSSPSSASTWESLSAFGGQKGLHKASTTPPATKSPLGAMAKLGVPKKQDGNSLPTLSRDSDGAF